MAATLHPRLEELEVVRRVLKSLLRDSAEGEKMIVRQRKDRMKMLRGNQPSAQRGPKNKGTVRSG